MSGTAIVTMIVICSRVWGGFAALLWRAMRRENQKQRNVDPAGQP